MSFHIADPGGYNQHIKNKIIAIQNKQQKANVSEGAGFRGCSKKMILLKNYLYFIIFTQPLLVKIL